MPEPIRAERAVDRAQADRRRHIYFEASPGARTPKREAAYRILHETTEPHKYDRLQRLLNRLQTVAHACVPKENPSHA
jgi:hypothetical protein